MRNVDRVLVVAAMAAWLLGPPLAVAGPDSPISGMSRDDLIKLAMSAAPASIGKDATVKIPGADGKLVEAKKGTNGFTCIPDLSGARKPDPMCGDAASWQWLEAYMAGAPAPRNTVPGVAYMARGGWHWEKGGKILMKEEAEATLVEEHPHWMLFWPVASMATGMPDKPAPFGTYVMFDGTPYAHLMIHQDPAQLK